MILHSPRKKIKREINIKPICLNDYVEDDSFTQLYTEGYLSNRCSSKNIKFNSLDSESSQILQNQSHTIISPVFSFLDQNALYRMRLVCGQWDWMAQTELLNRRNARNWKIMAFDPTATTEDNSDRRAYELRISEIALYNVEYFLKKLHHFAFVSDRDIPHDLLLNSCFFIDPNSGLLKGIVGSNASAPHGLFGGLFYIHKSEEFIKNNFIFEAVKTSSIQKKY